MQSSIAIQVLASVSENGFSLDELVYRTRKLFDEEGLAGFVALVLMLVDEKVTLDLTRGRSDWLPKPCCEAPRYELHDRLERRLRTSVGTLRIRWRHVRCVHCGRSLVPLRELLGLRSHQSKSSELERIVTEVVSEQSYRRTSRHLRLIGEIPVPRSTAHRWVAASDCDKTDTGEKTFALLLADGTGYKRRPDKAAGINNRGEARIAFGVENTGRIVPLGAWSGQGWQTIANDIRGKRAEGTPVAKMLVSDGEGGLVESLGRLCDHRQRCHWHGVRDLNYAMWKDKAPLAERKETQQELAGIIGIELPEEDFENVRPCDKAALERTIAEAEEKVYALWKRLLIKGYAEASGYVARMSSQLFSYVRRWLETGLVSPRVASWIERVMREIARRLKRIAFGWSPAGAAKMARIIIKRLTSASKWERYWKEKLRIRGDVILLLQSIKTV